MIIATIQSTNLSMDSKNIVVVDGVEKFGDEAEKYAEIIFDKAPREQILDNKIIVIDEYRFCVMPHPIKDEKGRLRRAMIMYDNNADSTTKEATIKAMGLNLDLWREIEKKSNVKNDKILWFVLVGVLIALFAILIIKG